jgi:MraZ protein
LKEYAGIDRDVVVAGVNDHLEIWDRATWRRELAESEGRTRDVAERLAAQRD